MAEPLDLEDKVVALFETPEATQEAVAALRADGHAVEVLEGEEGRRRLDPAESDEEGVLGDLKKAAVDVLGDEDRVLGKVDEELAKDSSFVVVDVSEADETDIAEALQQHGGHYLWHFGQWSYVPLAGARDEVDP